MSLQCVKKYALWIFADQSAYVSSLIKVIDRELNTSVIYFHSDVRADWSDVDVWRLNPKEQAVLWSHIPPAYMNSFVPTSEIWHFEQKVTLYSQRYTKRKVVLKWVMADNHKICQRVI